MAKTTHVKRDRKLKHKMSITVTFEARLTTTEARRVVANALEEMTVYSDGSVRFRSGPSVIYDTPQCSGVIEVHITQ
jgi:hypothetical protein